MILAGVFGGILFLLLLGGDWYQFTSLRPLAALYGLGIARRKDHLEDLTRPIIIKRFGKEGTIELPHGVARWFEDQEVITLRPYYQLFTMRFRTAWPLKGTVELHPTDTGVELRLTKRTPWSSSIITMAWLALVVIGTVVFLIMFGIDGGFGTAGGLLMALGVAGLGVLVLIFGLMMISLAYRLEDSRLMQVYQELQEVFLKKSKKSDPAPKEIASE
ncbi:MAG: hypothetical protein O2999_08205 [Nitrospirae bacterium]|nr:hypothetical protein [Nitrospirota bacterium]MDA1304268.1 hypothetical protein [Nitrospirota bacterium]